MFEKVLLRLVISPCGGGDISSDARRGIEFSGWLIYDAEGDSPAWMAPSRLCSRSASSLIYLDNVPTLYLAPSSWAHD
ncbi:hypothetical protein M7I_8282 [Glarea lozoyensis 74030]|uniref:Uncharacterized protein n=1 Tax=Glarea lozoyensis (strain ATCC 74030 / MF5533) TaxID=1104152 RepID=H0EZK8_GLAL7|nr:hypothetical protein M7I_8282 [Glarea lozoyensis 74030]